MGQWISVNRNLSTPTKCRRPPKSPTKIFLSRFFILKPGTGCAGVYLTQRPVSYVSFFSAQDSRLAFFVKFSDNFCQFAI